MPIIFQHLVFIIHSASLENKVASKRAAFAVLLLLMGDFSCEVCLNVPYFAQHEIRFVLLFFSCHLMSDTTSCAWVTLVGLCEYMVDIVNFFTIVIYACMLTSHFIHMYAA